MSQTLLVKVLANDILPPAHMTEGSAAIDLRVCLDRCTRKIVPGIPCKVRTGIAVAIPHGHVGIVAIRSGMAKEGLMLANGIGVIDSDYRGEICLLLTTMLPDGITIEHGSRVAQMMVTGTTFLQSELVSDLPETARGEGGFGHTGK